MKSTYRKRKAVNRGRRKARQKRPHPLRANLSQPAAKHGLADKIHVSLEVTAKPLKHLDVKVGSLGMKEILETSKVNITPQTVSPQAGSESFKYDPYAPEAVARRNRLAASISTARTEEIEKDLVIIQQMVARL